MRKAGAHLLRSESAVIGGHRLEVMGVLAAAGNGGEERGGRQRVG
jgi:hypothetical protein